MHEKEDFLSESHKVKERVKEKFTSILGAFIFGLVAYLTIGHVIRDNLITKEDKKSLELIREYKRMSTNREYLQKLKSIERDIRAKYPIVITPLQLPGLIKSPASKKYKLIGFIYVLFPFIASTLLWFYLQKTYSKAKREIFFQVHKEEKELYRKEPDYEYFTDTKIVNWQELVDVKSVLELYAFVGKLKEDEYDRLRNAVYLAKDLAIIYAFHTMHVSAKENKFQAIIYFTLWHYGMNLFGKVPVGYISRYIKDEELKTVISLYQRKRVPVSKEGALARKALMVLAYCHRDNGLYEVFEAIDPVR